MCGGGEVKIKGGGHVDGGEKKEKKKEMRKCGT